MVHNIPNTNFAVQFPPLVYSFPKLLIKENHAIFSKTVVVGLLFYINK